MFGRKHFGQLITSGILIVLLRVELESAPEQSFEWVTYTVVSVRFNTGQPDILATSASDCSIALYDSRMGKPRRRSLHEDKKCNHHHTNGKSKYSPTESLEMDLKIIWRVKGSG
ncbi:hypothetical protein L3X38_018900 [Prunus dulcis]|uniref:Transducin/WD40 repeat-like superfamily protein n=1 Tax=Prunus dulcis TaxID=3755 RepID=A0AAD4WAW3_PRUDU|nr:hypothetical protein L3X38_018900 [Prunus dulcis]